MGLRTKIIEMKKLLPLMCKPLEKIMSNKMNVEEGSVTEEKLVTIIKSCKIAIKKTCD